MKPTNILGLVLMAVVLYYIFGSKNRTQLPGALGTVAKSFGDFFKSLTGGVSK